MSDNPAEKLKAAIAAHQDGDLGKAEALYLDLIATHADIPEPWSNLAVIRRSQGYPLAAAALTRRALELKPGQATLNRNLFNALRDAGLAHEGLDLHRLDPNGQAGTDLIDPDWRAKVYLARGEIRRALHLLEEILARAPDNHDLALDVATALFKTGQFQRAFEVFEARWHLGKVRPPPKTGTRWTGGDIAGKDVVVVGEQGLGDMIFLSRFLPALAKRKPARLRASVNSPITRLFSGFDMLDDVSSYRDRNIGPETVWLSGFDLAWRLLPDDGTFPPPIAPHLPEAAVSRAKQIARPFATRFKIGIVWKTNSRVAPARRKNAALEMFLPLCNIPGVQLFSLHKDDRDNDIEAQGLTGLIVDAGSSDQDLADTAAVIREMDLVICIDTAAAHLAGMLGVPVWMLCGEPPFWYWNEIGESTPYYPSVRVIRQSVPGDWTDPFRRIVNDLTRMLR